ncbi:BON domain-containing protein [Microvirga splendida]|uniref:BON domain-containing protein n=1 Tax=Microvirga splendida TaxID=2795727 RepID=A0ABS0Y3C4_9HYPH|nr:BON domain-containing protein [Microvirga splendida]MBJ6126808.1 BON domain-containing protein [Microvirga splendida]
MANRNRFTGGSDNLDEYLHNEYRAEEGAYLEQRPDYARYGSDDRDLRNWQPRVPSAYYAEESFAGAGAALPHDEPLYRHDEPLYRDESGFERGRRDARFDADARRDRDPGFRRYDRHRSGRSSWEQDKRAGRELVQAAENFYEDFAGAVGLETEHHRERGYRGRGPRNYRRSDERILDEVAHRLTDDPHVDASDIEIGVKDREVMLSGRVTTRFEKRRAEDIAEAVSGVTHVQNNLRVRPA